MRVKLDENLGARGSAMLRSAGWDVATVVSEDLCASSDATLAEVCRAEGRVLISLDVDFANTIRFRPDRYAGLVVLRLPEPMSPEDLESALQRGKGGSMLRRRRSPWTTCELSTSSGTATSRSSTGSGRYVRI